MPVVRIDALCQCEGCGKRFGIEVDLGRDLNNKVFPDFEALVREEIRNGLSPGYTWGVRGKATVDRLPLTGWVTIQAELMLCDVCSRKCDDVPVERNLTRAEVAKVLGITDPEGSPK
jgi:hypothetical protein